MARSTNIYVVIDLNDRGLPCAGFTVKHELVSWFDKNHKVGYKYFRVKDGLGQEPKVTEIFYPFERK